MMLTLSNLIAAGIAPTQARAFLAPLSAACARFGINTALALSNMIATTFGISANRRQNEYPSSRPPAAGCR